MKYSKISADNYLVKRRDIYIEKFDIGDDSSLHTHDFIEIAYITSGKGRHSLVKSEEAVSAGDMIILSPEVPHRLYSHDGRLRGYNCIFHPSAVDISFEGCESFVQVACEYLFHSFNFPDNKKDHILLQDLPTREIRSLLDEMYAESAKCLDGYEQLLRLDLTKLLLLMFRLYREDSGQSQNKGIYKKLIVENSLKYMNEHFNTAICCEVLAKNAYVSTGYFARIFKEVTGKSIIKALQEIRIKKACELLSQTTGTVADIAEKCGYHDIKFFYSLFSATCGKTPGEYRKSARSSSGT